MKKHPTLYGYRLVVQPPKSSEQTCELHVYGTLEDDAVGRLLWLIAAALGGAIPFNAEEELGALLDKMEAAVPADSGYELGRVTEVRS